MPDSNITLVRHTRPLVADGICYGATDLAVAESFEQEALLVVSRLTKPEVLISSPLQRCQCLASKIAETFEVPVVTDERVREMDFGAWEGVPWDVIDRTQIEHWSVDFYHARPHGGESVAMLMSRVQPALDEFRATGKKYLIVCHAGIIKAAMSTGRLASDFETSVEFGGVVKLPIQGPDSRTSSADS